MRRPTDVCRWCQKFHPDVPWCKMSLLKGMATIGDPRPRPIPAELLVAPSGGDFAPLEDDAVPSPPRPVSITKPPVEPQNPSSNTYAGKKKYGEGDHKTVVVKRDREEYNRYMQRYRMNKKRKDQDLEPLTEAEFDVMFPRRPGNGIAQ